MQEVHHTPPTRNDQGRSTPSLRLSHHVLCTSLVFTLMNIRLILTLSESACLRRKRSLVRHQRGGIRKNATSVLDPAEDAQPQEIEVRPAEDDAFLQFQAVHLCFYLTLTPL